MITPSRRSLIIGIGASLIAAPAIVRASSLMKVKSYSKSNWLVADDGTLYYTGDPKGTFWYFKGGKWCSLNNIPRSAVTVDWPPRYGTDEPGDWCSYPSISNGDI